MRKPAAVVGVVALLLAGAAAAIYVGAGAIGYLADKARNLSRSAPARAAGASAVGAFGEPAGGLTGRWEVRSARIGPAGRFEVHVRFRNVSAEALGLQNARIVPIDAELLDGQGAVVPPTSQLSAAERAKGWREWGVLAAGEELTIAAGGRPGGPAIAAHLDVGTRRWVLAPGTYRLRGTYTSRYFQAPDPLMARSGARPWSGELHLPAVAVEVLAANRRP